MTSSHPEEDNTIAEFEMMYGTMYSYNDGRPNNSEAQGFTMRYCHVVSIGEDNVNFRFDNNIVHGTVRGDDFLSRYVYISSSGNTEIAGMNHNLYYWDDPDHLIHSISNRSYHMADWDDDRKRDHQWRR